MELLLWQNVLIAIYHEQYKERPQMINLLKGNKFGIKQHQLIECLIHLNQNERYINKRSPGPMLRLTREGREYIEGLCNINVDDNDNDKNNKITSFLKKCGGYLVEVAVKAAIDKATGQI